MKKYLLCLSMLLSSMLTFADPLKGHRILFLLDGSSSMSVPYAKGQTRFAKAAATILSIMDSISAKEKDVEFALRVYGHQHPAQEKNCFDTKMEVPFGKANRAQMELRLENLKPAGISPLAFSLRQISEYDLTRQFEYSVIIISDGGESCGGDICVEAKSLKQKSVIALSFVDLGANNNEMTALPCIKYQTLEHLSTANLAMPFNKTQNDDSTRDADADAAKYVELDKQFGFLLLQESANSFDISISNDLGDKVHLTKEELKKLQNGSAIRLPTGKYKIIYWTIRSNTKDKFEILAVVRKGMITNVLMK